MDNNKIFGVFGLGVSGVATINYLKSKGINFIAFDDRENVISNLSTNHPELANNFKSVSDILWQKIDTLILSPGIPESHPVVKIAKQIKARIICDIELLYEENKEAKYIGITGTNGKSTTTSLIAHILKFNAVNAIIGTPGYSSLNLETFLYFGRKS